MFVSHAPVPRGGASPQRAPMLGYPPYLCPHPLTYEQTSCARGDTICLRPLQFDNIFAFIRQVAPVLACWLIRHQQQVDV